MQNLAAAAGIQPPLRRLRRHGPARTTIHRLSHPDGTFIQRRPGPAPPKWLPHQDPADVDRAFFADRAAVTLIQLPLESSTAGPIAACRNFTRRDKSHPAAFT